MLIRIFEHQPSRFLMSGYTIPSSCYIFSKGYSYMLLSYVCWKSRNIFFRESRSMMMFNTFLTACSALAFFLRKSDRIKSSTSRHLRSRLVKSTLKPRYLSSYSIFLEWKVSLSSILAWECPIYLRMFRLFISITSWIRALVSCFSATY